MRKVLSFVLVLALVLGSFSMAFAATPATGLSDISTSANKDAIQAAYDLGIVTGNPDGTYLPTKAVNRAEFAAMITRAMAVPESALAGYTATTFKDTAGYDWAVKYLAFCETKGIILGDGQGNVMPGRTITVNEAVTMVLRAVGYTSNSNELIGSWPSNYVTLAQNLDLYDDVANAATVDKANAAQILYNALTLTKVVVDTEGKTTAAAGGKSLMTGNLGATVTTGATIDGSKFSNTSININGLIGQYGTKYENKDGKLLAFDPSSTALYGKMKVGDDTIFIADGVEYTLATSATNGTTSNVTVTSIVNAATKATNAYTLSGILGVDDDRKVTLNVKLSGKNITEIYSAVAWDSTANAKINAAQIEDITKNKTLLSGAFAKDNNGSIDTAQFTLLGASSLSSIAKDNIIYTYVGDGKIRKVTVGTSVVEGKVTAKNTTLGDAYVVVNGTKYYEATDKSGLPAVGDNTKLRLDYKGEVYSYSSTNTANKYGVVVGYSTESALSNAKAKIYTSADSATVYDFVGNADISTADTEANGFINNGELLKYRVDANGKIDTIVKGTQATTTTGVTVMALSTKVLQYTVSGAAAVVTTNYAIANDVVVFTHDNTTTGYALSKMADVNLGVQLATGTAATYGVSFILNGDGEVGALLVHENLASTTTTDSYGVVNTMADTTNSSNQNVQILSGFLGKTAFADKLTDSSDDFAFVSGAAYAFKIDAAGTITQVTSLGSVVDVIGDKASGYIVQNYKVTETNSDRTMLTVSNGSIDTKVGVAADAVVYKLVVTAGNAFSKYELASLTDIGVNDQVWAYDTKGRDADGVANMVIFLDK